MCQNPAFFLVESFLDNFYRHLDDFLLVTLGMSQGLKQIPIPSRHFKRTRTHDLSETWSGGPSGPDVSTANLWWASRSPWPSCGASTRANRPWTTRSWAGHWGTTKAATSWTRFIIRSSPIGSCATWETLSATVRLSSICSSGKTLKRLRLNNFFLLVPAVPITTV